MIILNTVGGDVEAGLAIAELISGMKKPTVSLVLGGGHSIGVPLACSAKPVSYTHLDVYKRQILTHYYTGVTLK